MKSAEELQIELIAMTAKLGGLIEQNYKMEEAASRAIITAEINNSAWLKDNVKLPPSMLAPTLLKRMKAVYKDGEFKRMNVGEDGQTSIPMMVSGLSDAVGDNIIKHLVETMPDYKNMMVEPGDGGITAQPTGNTILRSQWDKMDPLSQHEYCMKGGKVRDDVPGKPAAKAPANPQTKPTGKVISRAEFDTLDAISRHEHCIKGGKVVD